MIGRSNPPIIKLRDIGALWYDIIITCEVYYWSGRPYSSSALLPFFHPRIHPRLSLIPRARRILNPSAEVGHPRSSPLSDPYPTPLQSPPSLPFSPLPELWGSIREEACKGSAVAICLSTFFQTGSTRRGSPTGPKIKSCNIHFYTLDSFRWTKYHVFDEKKDY